MDKSYQLAAESKSYLISPWATEEISAEETCFEINGSVQAQSVLPANLTAFEVKYFFLCANDSNDKTCKWFLKSLQ